MAMRRRPPQQFESVEDDLIADIHALSGEYIVRGLPRNMYLERLYDLERRYIFPFMKLPTELRLLVYPDLLRHNPREGSKAYPAILRTCKTVHREASGILEAESVVELNIQFTGYPTKGRLDYFACQQYQSVYLHHSIEVDRVLTNLCRIQHLTLSLAPFNHSLTREDNRLSRCLRLFFKNLTEKCLELRTLKIGFGEELDGKKDYSVESYMFQLLGPLRVLPKGCDIKLEGWKGDVTEAIEARKEGDWSALMSIVYPKK